MGLYICRRTGESLGGRVWLEQSTPSGSTFSVWLMLDAPSPRDRALDDERDTVSVG